MNRAVANTKNTLKAIIFDMDGTLADTEEIHRLAFNKAFEHYQLACRWDESLYKELLAISGGRERIKRYLAANGLSDPGQGTTQEFAIRIHKTKSEIYRQMLLDGKLELRPGVERLIAEARSNNIKLAIATSSSTSNVETLLGSTLGKESAKLFETIVTCDIVDAKKPSPAVYNQVLANLGMYSHDCIAIEDTLNGNNAALAANIPTVITTHCFTTDEYFHGSSLVLNNLGDPGKPFTVSAGDSYGMDYVNLELLKKIRENYFPVNVYDATAAVAAE